MGFFSLWSFNSGPRQSHLGVFVPIFGLSCYSLSCVNDSQYINLSPREILANMTRNVDRLGTEPAIPSVIRVLFPEKGSSPITCFYSFPIISYTSLYLVLATKQQWQKKAVVL